MSRLLAGSVAGGARLVVHRDLLAIRIVDAAGEGHRPEDQQRPGRGRTDDGGRLPADTHVLEPLRRPSAEPDDPSCHARADARQVGGRRDAGDERDEREPQPGAGFPQLDHDGLAALAGLEVVLDLAPVPVGEVFADVRGELGHDVGALSGRPGLDVGVQVRLAEALPGPVRERGDRVGSQPEQRADLGRRCDPPPRCATARAASARAATRTRSPPSGARRRRRSRPPRPGTRPRSSGTSSVTSSRLSLRVRS